MIQVKDLRVNNIVKSICHGGLETEIHSVMPNNIKLWCNPLAIYNLTDIDPFELNEKWLLKFGFKSFEDSLRKDFNPRFSLSFSDGNPAECDLMQDGKCLSFKCSYLKYVHELQNLWYSLSGEDLTL